MNDKSYYQGAVVTILIAWGFYALGLLTHIYFFVVSWYLIWRLLDE